MWLFQGMLRSTESKNFSYVSFFFIIAKVSLRSDFFAKRQQPMMKLVICGCSVCDQALEIISDKMFL